MNITSKHSTILIKKEEKGQGKKPKTSSKQRTALIERDRANTTDKVKA